MADLNYSYYGNSTPCFYRNSDEETFLFVGSNIGRIIYYNDIDNNLTGNFNIIDTVFTVDSITKIHIYTGERSAPFVIDLDDDEYPELIVGNFSGGLNYFKGDEIPPDTLGLSSFQNEDVKINIYPNPVGDILKIKSDKILDKFNVKIISLDGRIIYEDNFEYTNFGNLNVNSLSSGIYVIKVYYETNNKVLSKYRKIIKI